MKTVKLITAALLLCLAPRAARAACALVNGQAASFALGQPDLVSNLADNGGSGPSDMTGPRRTFSDGVRLFVTDTDDNRVLIYNSLPTTQDQPADLVLGQADFNSFLANRGRTPDATTMHAPHGVFFDGTRLYVTDMANNRVLIWNSLPTSNGQAADLVLGQPDFASVAVNQGSSPSATTLYQAAGVAYRGGKLIIADTYNHRILIWNSLPTANDQAADVVVGQAGFTTNAYGTNAGGFQYPHMVDVYGSTMIVADTNNHRYLCFNGIPTANGASASSAIGQTSLTGVNPNGPGLGANSVSWATGFTVDPDGNLWIADYGNHRVLRYSGIPTTFAPAANLVLGQPDFVSNQINQTGLTATVQANTMYWPYGVTVAGGYVYVNEYGNNRTLAFACGPGTVSTTPTHTPTATPTFTASPTAVAAATATAVPSQAATATPGPWDGDEQHHRVRCWPNFSRGDQDHIGIDYRSHVGGHCSLKVLRGNNRNLCDLWQGNLNPHDNLHIDWDCRGDHGDLAASGVYYVVFTDGDGSCFTQKILIIR